MPGNTPLIFCTGILRSGSTWSYNVCRLLGKGLAIKQGQPFGSEYLTYDQLDQFIERHAGAMPGPTVIKAHGLGPIAMEWVHQGKAKAVCTYRDPRDCAVSMRTFFGDEINQAAGRIAMGLEFVKLYQMSEHTLFVRYEEMMENPAAEIVKIAAHVGLSLDPRSLEMIHHQTSVDASKEICQQLKNRPAKQVRFSGSHRVDPMTSLHDNHIFSAKSGRWREELTAEEARKLTKLFRPSLLSLGYETQESLAALEDVWQAVAAGVQMPLASEAEQRPDQNIPSTEHFA